MHQGGYTEFQYDVTPYVVVGANTNVLSVTVRKFSANPYVEGAEEGNVDYWVFGGIYRPVYLAAKPEAYIDYVAANPLANGNVTVSAFLGGINANYSVEALVTDTNDVRLGNVFSNSVSAGMTNVVLVRLAAHARSVVFGNTHALHPDGSARGWQRRGGAYRDQSDRFPHGNFCRQPGFLHQRQKSHHARRLPP